ncbi:hypothetical protein KMZ29_08405 [Bradyrhizobium sediminis]|uniref:Uncharacterized protein n=1 Tax=Bradyrhizobium sediminis TaxID=2840469 RepID=A0A975NHJ3_9BRAD|nr:hypothetical protein [Bradyrhizobium sediminis]QWG14666.1 hypothetical protein KMZ29_08405 [Bradyrhizobium sediminis]
MALGADELMEIDRVLSDPGADARVFTELRRRFPHLSWTKCDANDVTETPFRSYSRFEIHLVDRTDHCLQITADPARASGIVLANRNAMS